MLIKISGEVSLKPLYIIYYVMWNEKFGVAFNCILPIFIHFYFRDLSGLLQ